jgi:DNA-binding MarR family transcriptional regulator
MVEDLKLGRTSRYPGPVTATRPAAGTDLAGAAWRALLEYFVANRDRFGSLAAEVGLTVAGLKTLLSLDPDEPKSMRALADDWKCDASNVTWLVDRLEERQLVERRTLSSDRRVKTVVLTAAGERLKAEVVDRMHQPPEAFLALPPADLEALLRVLEKLGP